ncbi:MAG: hypothetical protein WCE63_03735, partial [Acidobacteriaceae bacterium]
DQRASGVLFSREVLPHLGAHAGGAAAGEALGGDDAVGLELLSAEDMIALGSSHSAYFKSFVTASRMPVFSLAIG